MEYEKLKNDKQLKKFVSTLKGILKDQNLSIRQFARQANMSYGYIGHILHFRRSIPKEATISKMAKGLRVNRTFLFHAAGYDYVPMTKEEREHASEQTILSEDMSEHDPVFRYKGKKLSKESSRWVKNFLDSIPDKK